MSWQEAPLGDLIDVLSGFAFKSSKFNSEGDGLPLVRIRDVVPGQTSTYFDGPFDERFLVKDRDILIGMDGEFNRARWRGGEALLNQRVCKVTPKKGKLHEPYLFYVLPRVLKEIEDRTPFVTVKHLSAKGLKESQIPFPPLEEQKRIAAILDQADALRRLRQRAVSALEKMKTSVFHQMFSQSLDTQPLGNIIKVGSGNGLTAKDMRGGDVPVYGGNGINGWHDEAFVDPQTVIIGRVGVYCGAVHITERKAWVTDNALIVRKLVDIETAYLAEALRAANLNQYAGRSAQPLVSGSRIYPV